VAVNQTDAKTQIKHDNRLTLNVAKYDNVWPTTNQRDPGLFN